MNAPSELRDVEATILVASDCGFPAASFYQAGLDPGTLTCGWEAAVTGTLEACLYHNLI